MSTAVSFFNSYQKICQSFHFKGWISIPVLKLGLKLKLIFHNNLVFILKLNLISWMFFNRLAAETLNLNSRFTFGTSIKSTLRIESTLEWHNTKNHIKPNPRIRF